jgi:hypothetical protein
MYSEKEIIIYFFIITISATNLYMPMIWFYVFLMVFLIPFLCDPARIFKRLWIPGIDSKEWIPPAYVDWRAGTITLFLFGS